MLYPQNGDRIVAIDTVTSRHSVYTEAVLSNSTRKLLWFEITEMLIAVDKKLLCHLL